MPALHRPLVAAALLALVVAGCGGGDRPAALLPLAPLPATPAPIATTDASGNPVLLPTPTPGPARSPAAYGYRRFHLDTAAIEIDIPDDWRTLSGTELKKIESSRTVKQQLKAVSGATLVFAGVDLDWSDTYAGTNVLILRFTQQMSELGLGSAANATAEILRKDPTVRGSVDVESVALPIGDTVRLTAHVDGGGAKKADAMIQLFYVSTPKGTLVITFTGWEIDVAAARYRFALMMRSVRTIDPSNIHQAV